MYNTKHSFEIIEVLEGGSDICTLTKVKDTITSEYLVMKKLKLEHKNAIERVKKEYLFMDRLRKIPNVVSSKYMHISEVDSMPTICMSYVRGLDIRLFLSKNPEKASYIFNQVMETLDEIHSVGICHGDVKFNNFIVTEKSEVNIIDFGAATDIKDNTEYTFLKSLSEKEYSLNRTFSDDEKDGIYRAETDFFYALKMFKDLCDNNAEILYNLDQVKEKFDYLDNIDDCTYNNIQGFKVDEDNRYLTLEQREKFDELLNYIPISEFEYKPNIKYVTYIELEKWFKTQFRTKVPLHSFYRLFFECPSFSYRPSYVVEASVIQSVLEVLKKDDELLKDFNSQVSELIKTVKINFDINEEDLPF